LSVQRPSRRAVLALMAAAGCGVGVSGVAAASVTTRRIGLEVPRRQLPAAGGSETLREAAPRSLRCLLRVDGPRGTLLSRRSRCAHGTLRVALHVPANTSATAVSYTVRAYAWFATGGQASAESRLTVLPRSAPQAVPSASSPGTSTAPASPPATSTVATNPPTTTQPATAPTSTVAVATAPPATVPATTAPAATVAPTSATTTTVPVPPTSFEESDNWSGYILPSDSLVTSVSGAWTVPTLDCSDTANASVSSWVGVGGAEASDTDLLQTGVEDDCVNGVQQNDAGWWEEYPEYYQVNFAQFPIAAGDSMEGSVYEDATGRWVTRVDDLTTGLSGWMVSGEGFGVGPDSSTTFQAQGDPRVSFPGGHSADWIVEDQTGSVSGNLLPFANYGHVTFSELASSAAAGMTGAQGVEMVQLGVVLSTPSQPSGDGFTVHYTGP
jgi:hypothetical protein